ncbi:hypothetical protein HHX47_DHR1001015 [Lentinula edodes]|nr:hypothetical protein HHX47_DHR1001015 [Lentinula edodes]
MDWHDSDPSEDGDAPESLSASRKRSSRGMSISLLKCIVILNRAQHATNAGKPKVNAKELLEREFLVKVVFWLGPGPSGKRFQPQGATKEDFFASVLRSNGGAAPGRDHSRSRRQSRVSREKVSLTQDRGLSVVPTQEWQDNLAVRLCSSGSSSSTYSVTSASSPDGPAAQRRRLDSTPTDSQGHPDWNDMYTLEALSDNEESDGITEGMGELSVTENQEIRYHGKASGLQFLSKNNRTDDRVEGGLWYYTTFLSPRALANWDRKMPMARVWPPSKDFAALTVQEDDIVVELPPIHIQDHLIDLYFTRTRENSPSSVSSPKPETAQKVTNLLLLSIFSIAARFCDDEAPKSPTGQMWEAGCDYLERARTILSVKLGIDICETVGRAKRDVDDAFGQENNGDHAHREAFRLTNEGGQQVRSLAQKVRPPEETGVQDLSQRLMAQMLGLVPGVEPSTSFFPGYEFWPAPTSGQGQVAEQISTPTSQIARQNLSYPQVSSNINTQARSNSNLNTYGGPAVGWMPDGNMMNVSNAVPEYNYPYNYSQYGP